MSQIETVHARQILDSRGNPTVEVELALRSGATGRAAVPSGASTGEFEATELRDGGDAWGGKGVTKAVGERQRRDRRGGRAASTRSTRSALDRRLIELDGTPNKSRLGANAILGVSLAAARAAAAEENQPLWRYLGRRVRARAAGADDERAQRRRPRRQLGRLPGVHGRPGRRRLVRARRCRWAPRCSTRSRRRCSARGLNTAVGDEGGFAPDLESNEAALQALIEGIEAAGYTPGDDVAIALDPATSEIFEGGVVRPRQRGPQAVGRGDGRLLGRRLRALPDPLDRGRHGRGGLGRLAARSPSGSASASSSSATTCSSPTPSGSSAASTAGVGQLDPHQGQPDRHADRDAGRDRHGARGRLHGGHVAPLGRDRGHHDRRPGRGHRLRADQDRRAVALATAWRSTTSCCGSRRRSAATPSTRAAQRRSRVLNDPFQRKGRPRVERRRKAWSAVPAFAGTAWAAGP